MDLITRPVVLWMVLSSSCGEKEILCPRSEEGERRKKLGRKPRESTANAIEIQMAANTNFRTIFLGTATSEPAKPAVRSESFPHSPRREKSECSARQPLTTFLTLLGTQHRHEGEPPGSSPRRLPPLTVVTRSFEIEDASRSQVDEGLGSWRALLGSHRPNEAA